MLNEIKNNVVGVVGSCDTVQFCTFQEDGSYPETRTIANAINKGKTDINDMTLYFMTNKNSHKAQQIKSDSNVCLYYFNPETRRSVSLFGTAELILEQNEKVDFWRDEWVGFGYCGKDDQNYCIIKFTPKIYKYFINKTEEITGKF